MGREGIVGNVGVKVAVAVYDIGEGRGGEGEV